MKAYKHSKKMQGIAGIRMRLGIGQQDFARLLGISQSMVSRAEGGSRSLSAAALQKLSAIEIQLAAGAAYSDLPLPEEENFAPPTEATPPEANPELQQRRYTVEEYQYQLQLMVEQYDELKEQIGNIRILLHAPLKEGEAPALQPAYLKTHLLTLQEKIKKYDLTAQAVLQQKMDGLKEDAKG